MNIQELKIKKDNLLEQWKSATGVNKKILEIRGKCLRIAIEKKMTKQQKLI